MRRLAYFIGWIKIADRAVTRRQCKESRTPPYTGSIWRKALMSSAMRGRREHCWWRVHAMNTRCDSHHRCAWRIISSVTTLKRKNFRLNTSNCAKLKETLHYFLWRCGGLMVNVLDSGSGGLGFEPWLGSLCCVLRQDTLLSQCFSSPRCTNGYQQICWG